MYETLCLLPILADSNGMPFEKKIGIIFLFGAIGALSVVGLFAPRTLLEKMAGLIGTKNPIVARIVCAIGALVGWGFVALVVSTFVTGWDV